MQKLKIREAIAINLIVDISEFSDNKSFMKSISTPKIKPSFEGLLIMPLRHLVKF